MSNEYTDAFDMAREILTADPHRWIPCAERMPEIDVDVLVFTGGPTMLLNSDRVAIGCWAGSDWETSLGVYNPPIISHWMPLPEGPEVKG